MGNPMGVELKRQLFPLPISFCYPGLLDTTIMAMNTPIMAPNIAPDQGFEVIPQVLPAHFPRYPIPPPTIAPIAAPII